MPVKKISINMTEEVQNVRVKHHHEVTRVPVLQDKENAFWYRYRYRWKLGDKIFKKPKPKINNNGTYHTGTVHTGMD
jgi:hypothetical protein